MNNAKEIFKKAFYFLLKEETQKIELDQYECDSFFVGGKIKNLDNPEMTEGITKIDDKTIHFQDNTITKIVYESESDSTEAEVPEVSTEMAAEDLPATSTPEEIAPKSEEDVDALKKEIEDLKKQIEDMKKEAKAKEEIKMSAEPATQAPKEISDKVAKNNESGFKAQGKFAALIEMARSSN
jgi:hypothetical protein